MKQQVGDPVVQGLRVPSSPFGASVFRAVSWLALATGLALSLYVLWKGWNQPLIDMHGFRQTQTALTVYWLLQGGDWLAHETPVLGAPWSVPFEFPVYQWLVALLASVSSASIDHAGRAVSYAALLLCLIPLRTILREVGAAREAFPVTAALLLMAPIYLFWGRTFMIETAALLFALTFLALHLQWVHAGRPRAALGALLFGALGILTKVTTFAPYALLAAALSVPPAVALIRSGRWSTLALRGVVALGVAGFSLLALVWWLGFSDQIKSLNLLGEHLTSQGLSAWNFGTYEQRSGEALWASTIRDRAIPEAVGSITLVWVALGVALMVRGRAAFLVAAFVLAWLSAFLIFTNLHIVHNYYQVANAALLVSGLGLVIVQLGQSRPLIASAFLVLTMSTQWYTYQVTYRPVIQADFFNEATMQISHFIKRETPRQSAILVLGRDWSSEIPYYSERKAIALPGWIPPAKFEAVLSAPDSFLGALPLSAVVYCRDATPDWQRGPADAALSRFPVRRTERVAGCDVHLTGSQ